MTPPTLVSLTVVLRKIHETLMTLKNPDILGMFLGNLSGFEVTKKEI